MISSATDASGRSRSVTRAARRASTHSAASASRLRQSVELRDEEQFIADCQAALEGSFAVMFAEITLRRLNAKGVQKKRIDPDHFVNRLDLPDFPYTLWSDMIEKAVVAVMSSRMENRYCRVVDGLWTRGASPQEDETSPLLQP
jgi:hypothetical protein